MTRLADGRRAVLAKAVQPLWFRSRLRNLLDAADATDASTDAIQTDDSEGSRTGAPPIKTDPGRYGTEVSFNGVERPVVFLSTEEEFQWMEQRIIFDGYYEAEGIWGFHVDIDKQAIAWMAQCLIGSGSALDIGSANGATVSAMRTLGLDAVGIDISRFALQHVVPGTEEHLFHGDVLEHHFDQKFDLILAMDLLEHVSPFRVPDYLKRIESMLSPGGKALFNIPVWGDDPVWGNVFPVGPCTYHHAFPSWEAAQASNDVFTTIPVDEDGYPVLGHLVWAGSPWWTTRFEGAGLVRFDAIERAFHDRLDWFFNITSIARRSFYVLGRSGDDNQAVIDRITERNPTSHSFPPHPGAVA